MKLIPFTTFRSNRPVVAHNPWVAFDSELDRLFGPILSGVPASYEAPRASVEASDTQVTVRFEVPGVKRDALNLDWQDETLTLTIKRDVKQGGETVSREHRHTYTLPEGVQVDKASAQLEDGVLTLQLPKVEPVKPYRIEIK